jgi:hypothetical protein
MHVRVCHDWDIRDRNLILFIPDGLRALKVTSETAPAITEVRDKGVNFNSGKQKTAGK